jgi:hypothetical protein
MTSMGSRRVARLCRRSLPAQDGGVLALPAVRVDASSLVHSLADLPQPRLVHPVAGRPDGAVASVLMLSGTTAITAGAELTSSTIPAALGVLPPIRASPASPDVTATVTGTPGGGPVHTDEEVQSWWRE